MEGSNVLPLVLQLLVDNKNIQKDITAGLDNVKLPPVKGTIEITPELAETLSALVNLEKALRSIRKEMEGVQQDLTKVEKESKDTANKMGRHGKQVAEAFASGGPEAGSKALESIIKRLEAGAGAAASGRRTAPRRSASEARLYKIVEEVLARRMKGLEEIMSGEDWRKRREELEGADGTGGLVEKRRQARRRRSAARARVSMLQGDIEPLVMDDEEFDKHIEGLRKVIKDARARRPDANTQKELRSQIIALNKERADIRSQLAAAQSELPALLDRAHELGARIRRGGSQVGGEKADRARERWRDAVSDTRGSLGSKTARQFFDTHVAGIESGEGVESALEALGSRKSGISQKDRTAILDLLAQGESDFAEVARAEELIQKSAEEQAKLEKEYAELLQRIQALRTTDTAELRKRNKAIDQEIKTLRTKLRGRGHVTADRAAQQIRKDTERRRITQEISDRYGPEVVDALVEVQEQEVGDAEYRRAIRRSQEKLTQIPDSRPFSRAVAFAEGEILRGSIDPLTMDADEYSKRRAELRGRIAEGRESRPDQAQRQDARKRIIDAQQRLRDLDASSARREELEGQLTPSILKAEDPLAEFERREAEVRKDIEDENLSDDLRLLAQTQMDQLEEQRAPLQEYMRLQEELQDLPGQREAIQRELAEARSQFRGGETGGETAVRELRELSVRRAATESLRKREGDEIFREREAHLAPRRERERLRARIGELDVEIENIDDELVGLGIPGLEDVEDYIASFSEDEVDRLERSGHYEEVMGLLDAREAAVKERAEAERRIQGSTHAGKFRSASSMSDLQRAHSAAIGRLRQLTDEDSIKAYTEDDVTSGRRSALMYTRDMSVAEIEEDIRTREGRIAEMDAELEAMGPDAGEERTRLELQKKYAERRQEEIRNALEMRQEVETTLSDLDRQMRALTSGDTPEALLVKTLQNAQKEEDKAHAAVGKVERELQRKGHIWISTAEFLTTTDPAKLQAGLDPELRERLSVHKKRRQELEGALREVSEEMAQIDAEGAEDRSPETQERYDALQIRRDELSRELDEIGGTRGEFLERILGVHGVGEEATAILERLTGGVDAEGRAVPGLIELGEYESDVLADEIAELDMQIEEAGKPAEELRRQAALQRWAGAEGTAKALEAKADALPQDHIEAMKAERAKLVQRKEAVDRITSERQQLVADVTSALSTTQLEDLGPVLEGVRSQLDMWEAEGDAGVPRDPQEVGESGQSLLNLLQQIEELKERLAGLVERSEEHETGALDLTSSLEQMGLTQADLQKILPQAMGVPEGASPEEFRKAVVEGIRGPEPTAPPTPPTTPTPKPEPEATPQAVEEILAPEKKPGILDRIKRMFTRGAGTPATGAAGISATVGRLDTEQIRKQWAELLAEFSKSEIQVNLNTEHLRNQWNTLFEELTAEAISLTWNTENFRTQWNELMEELTSEGLELPLKTEEFRQQWAEFREELAEEGLDLPLSLEEFRGEWSQLLEEIKEEKLQVTLDGEYLREQWDVTMQGLLQDPLKVQLETEIAAVATAEEGAARKEVISEVVAAATASAGAADTTEAATAAAEAVLEATEVPKSVIPKNLYSELIAEAEAAGDEAGKKEKKRKTAEEKEREKAFKERIKYESEVFRQDLWQDPVETLTAMGWEREAELMKRAREADAVADPEAARMYSDLYREVTSRRAGLGSDTSAQVDKQFLQVLASETKKLGQGAQKVADRTANLTRTAALESSPEWREGKKELARSRQELRDELKREAAEQRRRAWIEGPYKQIQEQLLGFESMRTPLGVMRNPYEDREKTYRNMLTAHSRLESDLVRLAGIEDEDARMAMEAQVAARQREFEHAEDMYRMARLSDHQVTVPRMEAEVVRDASGEYVLQARQARAPRWEDRGQAMDTRQAKAFWDEALKGVEPAERSGVVRELTDAIKTALREAHSSGEAVDFQGDANVLSAYRGVARKLGMKIDDAGRISMAAATQPLFERVSGDVAYRQADMALRQEFEHHLKRINAQIRQRREELAKSTDPAALAELSRTREFTFDELLDSIFGERTPTGVSRYQRELLKSVKIEKQKTAELNRQKKIRDDMNRIVREETRMEQLSRRMAELDRARNAARSNNPYRHAIRAASYQMGLYSAGFMAAYQVRAAIGRHMEIEQAMAGIQGVLRTQSPEDRDRLQVAISQTALRYGADLLETAQAARILAQSGLTLSEIMEELDTTMLAMRGLDMTIEQMQELQIAVKSITGEAGNSILVLEKISNVERQFAITSQDLAEALKIFSPVAAQFTEGMRGIGDAFDYTIAMATVMVEQLRITGKQAGDSLKFIFARLLSPDISRNLQEIYGLRLARDEDGMKMLSLPDMLDEIYFRYQSLMLQGQEAQASRMLAQLSGGRRVNQVLALFHQYDRILEIARISSYAFGDAQERASISMDTLHSSIQKLRTGFQLFVSGVMETSGAANVLRGSVEGLTRALEFSARTGSTLPMLGLLVAGVSAGAQAARGGLYLARLARDASAVRGVTGMDVGMWELHRARRAERARRIGAGVDVTAPRRPATAIGGIGRAVGGVGRGVLAGATSLFGVFGVTALGMIAIPAIIDLLIKGFQRLTDAVEKETVRLERHTATSLGLRQASHFRGYMDLAEQLGYDDDLKRLYEESLEHFIVSPLEEGGNALGEMLRSYGDSIRDWRDLDQMLSAAAPDVSGLSVEDRERERVAWMARREEWEKFSGRFHDTLMKNVDQFGELGQALSNIADEEERRIAISRLISYMAWNANVMMATSVEDATVKAQQLMDSLAENLDNLDRRTYRWWAGLALRMIVPRPQMGTPITPDMFVERTSMEGVIQLLFRTSMFEDGGKVLADAFLEGLDTGELMRNAQEIARMHGMEHPTRILMANLAMERILDDAELRASTVDRMVGHFLQQSDVQAVLREAGLATDAVEDPMDASLLRARTEELHTAILEGIRDRIQDDIVMEQVTPLLTRALANLDEGSERFKMDIDTTREALVRLKNVLLDLTLSFYRSMQQIEAESDFSRMLGTGYNPNEARIQAARQFSIGLRTIDDEYASNIIQLEERRRRMYDLIEATRERMDLDPTVVSEAVERRLENMDQSAEFRDIPGVQQLDRYIEEYAKLSGEIAAHREQYDEMIVSATNLLDLLPEGEAEDVITPRVRQQLEAMISEYRAGGAPDDRLVSLLKNLADNVALRYQGLERDLASALLTLELSTAERGREAERRRQAASLLGSREAQFAERQAAAEMEYLAERERMQREYQERERNNHIMDLHEHQEDLRRLDETYQRERAHEEALFDLETRRIELQERSRILQDHVAWSQAIHDLTVSQIRAEMSVAEQTLRRESAARRLLRDQIHALEQRKDLLDHERESQIDQLLREAERTQWTERQNMLLEKQNELLDQARRTIEASLSGIRSAATDLDMWSPLADDRELDRIRDTFDGIDSRTQARLKVLKDNLLSVIRPVADALYGRVVDGFMDSLVDSLMETRIRDLAVFSEIRMKTAISEAETLASGVRMGGFSAGDYIRQSIELGGRSAATSMGLSLEALSGGGSSRELVPGLSRLARRTEEVGDYMQEQSRLNEIREQAEELRGQQMKEALGMMGGTVAGSVAGGGGQWAQMGSTAGALLGTLIPGVGNVVGSVLGGVAGGLLGGLFDDDERDQQVQVARLEAIERAQRDTITAIDNQTDVLLDLENRLVNLPSTFNLPSVFGGFAAQGGNVRRLDESWIVGEEGPEIFEPGRLGQIRPVEVQPAATPHVYNNNQTVSVTVNVSGGDPEEVERAVTDALDKHLGTTLHRQRSSRGRGRSRV